MRRLIRRNATNRSGRGVFTLGLLILFCCTVSPALGQIPAPVMVQYFDTGGFGAPSPDGLSYISSGTFADNFAIVDNNPDKVFIADRNGILKSQIDIAAFAPNATGVAFIPNTQRFAVVDNILDEVYFFNNAGSVQSNFDTAGFGCLNPQGITFISSGTFSGNLAIIDTQVNTVFIVNLTGALQGSFSTGPLGANNPSAITFIPGDNNFAILDNTLNDVILVNSFGIEQKRFDVNFVSNFNLGLAYDPTSGNLPIASANQAEVFFMNADGEVATNFSTFIFGSEEPTGITYIPATQKYAIVDAQDDRVYFVDTDGTNPTSCAIGTFSTFPGGISYIPQTGNLAVVDNSVDKVFIIDQTCTLLSQFDLATFGINALTPAGIASVPGGKSATGQFEIVDQTRDGVKRIDPALPGRIQSQFSLAGLQFFFPDGITLLDGTGNLAMVDSSRDDAFVTDSRGVLLALFDTTPFATTPRGIAFDSDTGRIAIVDSGSDQVTILDLPALLDLPELCACDLNNDGRCNILDYQGFIQDWGNPDCP